jgi:hypothetical protein
MISDMTRDSYLSMRRQYQPERPRLVIVAESPPASGLYFYNRDGAVTEPLFAAMMKQVGYAPKSKQDGLSRFQQEEWVLVDATYQPVDKLGKSKKERTIVNDYPLLRADLTSLLADPSVPLILIKANICRLLEPKLKADGFRVLNQGRIVYFPAFGKQNVFHRQFSEIARAASVSDIQFRSAGV